MSTDEDGRDVNPWTLIPGPDTGLAPVEDDICSSYALTEEGEQLFSARDGAQFIFSMFHLMIVLLCVLARAFQESLSSLMDSVREDHLSSTSPPLAHAKEMVF